MLGHRSLLQNHQIELAEIWHYGPPTYNKQPQLFPPFSPLFFFSFLEERDIR